MTCLVNDGNEVSECFSLGLRIYIGGGTWLLGIVGVYDFANREVDEPEPELFESDEVG